MNIEEKSTLGKFTSLHKKLNIILSTTIFLISIYVISFPLIPEIQFRIQSLGQTKSYKYGGKLAQKIDKDKKVSFQKMNIFQKFVTNSRNMFSQQDKTNEEKYATNTPGGIKDVENEISEIQGIPMENTLVIPQIGVDGSVVEGTSIDVLKSGFWHRPNTSTPAKGGNTVIIGHRFLYKTGPKTFYGLDRLNEGDEFALFWEGKEYIYRVFEKKVIEPTEMSIEANTDEPMLTLYTCTPLWTAKQRLVVRAKPL